MLRYSTLLPQRLGIERQRRENPDLLRLTEPRSGARACDPQRVSAYQERGNASLFHAPPKLRLTEPRSEKFARPVTIPADSDRYPKNLLSSRDCAPSAFLRRNLLASPNNTCR